MLEMRSSQPLVSIALAVALVGGATSLGCATTAGSANGDRVVVAVDAQQRSSSDVVEITEIVPPVAVAAPEPARRRLSQTVTLGQGTSEQVYPTTAAPQAAAGGGNSQNVTVNNNVTVVQPAPVYGYGTYGGYSRSYGGTTGRDGFGGRGTSTNQAWAPSGWEGAGRTAAPGHTPGVGGNFSPAPSFGPRPMR